MNHSKKDHSREQLRQEPESLAELHEYQWDITPQNEVAKQIYNIEILQEFDKEIWDKHQVTIH